LRQQCSIAVETIFQRIASRSGKASRRGSGRAPPQLHIIRVDLIVQNRHRIEHLHHHTVEESLRGFPAVVIRAHGVVIAAVGEANIGVLVVGTTHDGGD